jgi:hypothetical protein
MSQHRTPSTPISAALVLPPVIVQLMAPFRSLFTAPVWHHVLVLIAGAMLAPGKRTVCSALRVMGLGGNGDFALYHHVLSRARWNARAAARKLFVLIVDRFVPDGAVVMGIDDTIERRLLAAIRQASRRWGAKIAARGIYRDPVRSSEGHFVTVKMLA